MSDRLSFSDFITKGYTIMKSGNIKSKSFSTIVIALGMAFSLAIGAVVGAYSSEDDPLISLSYINEVVIPNIKSYIEQRIGESKLSQDSVPVISYEQSVPVNYEVVALTKDQELIAEDSVEIILRSGQAVVISPFDNQGIGNMANGAELLNGEPLPKNNYCIIPRGDGRGVHANTDGCYFLVRGEYVIK